MPRPGPNAPALHAEEALEQLLNAASSLQSCSDAMRARGEMTVAPRRAISTALLHAQTAVLWVKCAINQAGVP